MKANKDAEKEQLLAELMRELGSKGGKATANKLGREGIIERSRKAGLARQRKAREAKRQQVAE